MPLTTEVRRALVGVRAILAVVVVSCIALPAQGRGNEAQQRRPDVGAGRIKGLVVDASTQGAIPADVRLVVDTPTTTDFTASMLVRALSNSRICQSETPSLRSTPRVTRRLGPSFWWSLVTER